MFEESLGYMVAEGTSTGTTSVWGTYGIFIYIIFIVAIIYFFLIRPQSKRKKEQNNMINNLTVGVEVVSIGGIHGEVSRIKDDTIWMKVSNNVEIELEKSAIGRVIQ